MPFFQIIARCLTAKKRRTQQVEAIQNRREAEIQANRQSIHKAAAEACGATEKLNDFLERNDTAYIIYLATRGKK